MEGMNAFYSRLCGIQSRFGRVRNISPPARFNPWTFRPVASRCTDFGIAFLVNDVCTYYPYIQEFWQLDVTFVETFRRASREQPSNKVCSSLRNLDAVLQFVHDDLKNMHSWCSSICLLQDTTTELCGHCHRSL
jgi:hypothetical protein